MFDVYVWNAWMMRMRRKEMCGSLYLSKVCVVAVSTGKSRSKHVWLELLRGYWRSVQACGQPQATKKLEKAIRREQKAEWPGQSNGKQGLDL